MQHQEPIGVRVRFRVRARASVRIQRPTEPTAPGTVGLEKECQNYHGRAKHWLPSHFSILCTHE